MDRQNTREESPLSEYLPTAEAETTVRVYLRSLAPPCSYSAQERLIERLKSLEEAGRIDDISVTVWGEQVCTDGELSDLSYSSQIVGAIGDFFELASRSAIEISPFFRVKEISSSIAGEQFRCITVPERCLAFYSEGSVIGLYPCKIDDVVYTPEDALSQYERSSDSRQQQQPGTSP